VRAYGRPVRGLADPGIAIKAPAGTEVCAVAAGRIIAVVGADGEGVSAWGRSIAVSHSDGYVSWYGHLNAVLVRKGQKVSKGQAIATVGASGAASEPQLAFRLYHNDRPVDPMGRLP
jgi:murein DD-endopeptidase MepM/ murein hydrolase activator NlpD